MKHAEAYDKARKYLVTAIGSSKNACAATASYHLKDFGELKGIYINTRDLYNKIRHYPHITLISELECGDICFSCDLDGMYMADHVFIFSHKIESEAVILDNYSRLPGHRNLRKGPKTPFAFAIRIPGMKEYTMEALKQ